MFRTRLVVSRFACGIIAVENIVKPACGIIAVENVAMPACDCHWHKLGMPEYCIKLDQHLEDEFSERQMDDDWPDDYPGFDDGFEDPCRCYNCRHGHPEHCVTHDDDLGIFEGMDDLWDEIDLTFIDDGSVPFDDIPEPVVRVSKIYRVNHAKKLERCGIIVASIGSIDRLARSREHETRKKHFMVPRRKRARIGTVLAREEMIEREERAESDSRNLAANFPEDRTELLPVHKSELLQRNFPALSASSAHCIATSRRIQASSTFKGLEGLQKFEEHVSRKNEEYFSELDGYFPDEDSLSTAHALVDSFNQCALLAFRR